MHVVMLKGGSFLMNSLVSLMLGLLKQRNRREAKRRVLMIRVHGKLNIPCIVRFRNPVLPPCASAVAPGGFPWGFNSILH